MYEQVLKLRDAGLSVVVLGDDKGKPLGGWKQFQSEIISEVELKKKCGRRDAKNVAIIGGGVSGQLCQLDFDDHNKLGCVYGEWWELVRKEFPGYFDKLLVIHKTPGGGYHVRWRVETDEKLPSFWPASRWLFDKDNGEIVLDTRGKPKTEAIIEVIAEKKYALCPPSPGYKLIQGSLLEIPMISYESHHRLITIASMFHTAVQNPPPEPEPQTKKSRKSDGLSPGDDFNKRGDHKEILAKHGWTLAHSSGSKEYWKHPTTENLTSATWNCMPELPDRFYCFSPNTPFEQKKPYHKFAIYTVLECEGDFTLAAKRLAAEGYGKQRKPEEKQSTTKQRTSKRQPILLTGEDRYIELRALIEQHFRKGTKPDKIFGVAKDCNDKRCQPPIPDDEIIALINSLKPRLKTFTAKEIMEMDIPPPKWAVEGFIAEGLTVFAGKQKIGKSWMMLGIARAVALGGKALGQIDVVQGDVLYCAIEDNMRRLQERLDIVAQEDGIKPERLHFVALGGQLPRMDKGGLDLIGTFLDDHPDTRMVIIDILQKFRPHGNSRRNAYEEDYDVIGTLQSFALNRGIALVTVHHKRKAEADYELDEVSGSTGTTGASDNSLILTRTVDGPILYRQGRDVIEESFAVDFDAPTCLWTLRGEAKEVRMSDSRKQIVEFLEATNEGMGAKAIAAALGKNYSTTRGLLLKLMEEGVIIKVGAQYLIPRIPEEELF